MAHPKALTSVICEEPDKDFVAHETVREAFETLGKVIQQESLQVKKMYEEIEILDLIYLMSQEPKKSKGGE